MNQSSVDIAMTNTYRRQRWWPSLSTKECWGICVILVGALLVRFIGITTESLWVDEAASWGFSRLPLTELWRDIPSYEPHPPLFYTLLKFWTSMFGTSETALRGLSLLASVVVVFMVFLIGRLLVRSSVVGLGSAAVVAIHPVQIYFAQEARSYALLTLGFSMAFLALSWWNRHPDALAAVMQRERSDSSFRNRQAIGLFVFGATLAFWLHHTAILVIGSALAVGAAVVVVGARDRLRTAAVFLLIGLTVTILWLPCGALLLRAIDELSASGHVPAPGHRMVIYGVDYVLGTGFMSVANTSTKHLVSIALIGIVASAGALALARGKHWRSLVLLCTSITVPIVAALVGSYAVTPMFAERVLVWTQISYAILIASSLLWLPGKALGGVGVFMVMAVFASARIIDPAHKEPWRQIVGTVEKESVAGDLLFSWFDFAQVPMEYYKVADRVKADRLRLWTGTGLYPTMEEAIFPGRRMPWDEALERVMEAERTHGTIWIVTRASYRDQFMLPMNAYLTRMRGPPIQRIYFLTPGFERTNPPTILVQYRKRNNESN